VPYRVSPLPQEVFDKLEKAVVSHRPESPLILTGMLMFWY